MEKTKIISQFKCIEKGIIVIKKLEQKGSSAFRIVTVNTETNKNSYTPWSYQKGDRISSNQEAYWWAFNDLPEEEQYLNRCVV